jgi:tetratricopeptide (TPR) repeat protein
VLFFLGIEAIKEKGEKKAGRYSLRLEAKSETSSTLENEIEVKQVTVEINIHESLTRKLQEFAEFHKAPASIKNIRIGETLTEQLEWEEVLGNEIFQAFFPGFIGKTFEYCLNLLHQDKVDSLTLIIGSSVPWILDIPFEMMRKDRGGTPLSLCHQNFHLVHSIETSINGFQEESSEASAPPLKILFVSALPVDLPDEDRLIELEKEQERLIAAVGELISEQKVVVEFLDIATLEEIEKSLRESQHQVVHFSGHGSHPETSSQDRGVLYLEDEWGCVRAVTGQELAQSLKKFPFIRLVVLSACETARADETGVAGAMLKAGIPAALGMRYHVDDKAASLFTTCFYYDICTGKSLDRAIYYARHAVYDAEMKRIKTRQKKKKEELIVTDWMTPFLYQSRFLQSLLDPGKKPTDIQHFFHKPQSPLVEGAKYVGRGFIGRHREILHLHRLIREGHRSICIYGQGGTGKTTLAVRFAHHFEKGAFRIIRFDNAVSEESILSRLAEAASPSLGEGIKNFVQTPDYDPVTKLNLLIEDFLSKQKIILLFDNFEENQIGTTGSVGYKTYQREIHSESLKALLVFLCKNLKKSSFILFTTRYRFTEPEIVCLNLGEMCFSDTFKLINRFRKLVHLTHKEKRRIHKKLGGHPRALELLESCVSHEDIGWISVVQRFQEVEDKEISQDLLMDMLWIQLTDDEKKSLMGASIFRGLTALEGLMAVTHQNQETIEQCFQALNALSLLYRENNLFYTHRFTATFIKTTKIDEDQLKEHHINAAGYFEGIEDENGRKDIEVELEARWHYLEAGEFDRAAEITTSVEKHITLFGYPQFSFELLVESGRKALKEKNRSNVLYQIGILYQHFGNNYEALKHYQKAMQIYENIEDIKGISRCFHQIGNIYFFRCDYEEALKLFKKSLEISEKIADIKGVSDSLGQIGNIYNIKEDYDEALKQYKKSLGIFEKIGDLKGLSDILNNIGGIYQCKGDYDEAIKYNQKSMEIHKEINDLNGFANSLVLKGKIYQDKKNYEEALEQYQEALEIFEKTWDTKGASNSLLGIGTIYRDLGNFSEALKYIQKALEIFEKAWDIKGVSTCLLQIGLLYYLKEDYDEALKCYKKVLDIFEKNRDIKGISITLPQIGIIYQQWGNYDEALKIYQNTMEIFEKNDNIKGVSDILHQIGSVYHSQGENKDALKHYKKSMEIKEKICDIEGIAHSYGQMGILYFESEDFKAALRYFLKAYLILVERGSPKYQLAIEHIFNVRDKLDDWQFKEVLNQLDFPSYLSNNEKNVLREDADKKSRSIFYHHIGSLFLHFGDYEEALNQYQIAMGIAEKINYTKGISSNLEKIGVIYQYRGDYDEALKQYQKAIEIFEKINDREGVSTSLSNIGTIYLDEGEYEKALKNFKKSMEIAEEIHDIKGFSLALHQIGIIDQHKGNYDKALKKYKKAMKIRKKIVDIKGVSQSLNQIGNISSLKGDYDEALKYYQEAIEIAKKIGDIKGVSINLHNIGAIYQQKGNLDEALKHYQKSIQIREKIGDILGSASLYGLIGMIYKEREDFQLALEYFIQAYINLPETALPQVQQIINYIHHVQEKMDKQQFQKIINKLNIHSNLSAKDEDLNEKNVNEKKKSSYHHKIGILHLHFSDYDESLAHLKKSVEIQEKIGNAKNTSYGFHIIATIYRDKGDYENALEHYRRSMAIREKIGDIKGASYDLHQIGIVYQYKGDYDLALDKYQKSIKMRETIGDIKGISDSLHQIGNIYSLQGNYFVALNQYQKSKEIRETIEDLEGVSNSFFCIGRIYHDIGDFDEALKQYQSAMEIGEKIAYIKIVSNSLNNIGTIYQLKGDYEESLKHFLKAIELAEKIGDVKESSDILHNIGIIYQAKGDYNQALKRCEKAMEIRVKIGDNPGKATSFSQLGMLHFETKNYNKALIFFIKAFLVFSELGSPNAKLAISDILKVKEMIPLEQFNEALNEFKLAPYIFEKNS